MQEATVIVGGGIGGLAAALAIARTGTPVQLLEQALAFGEVGAGIQLGPNVVRVLQGWGLGDALKYAAAFPAQLEVRNALSGRVVGVLPLGERAMTLYGAPYATIARPDMHSILLKAVQKEGVTCQLGAYVNQVTEQGEMVQVETAGGDRLRTPLLIGADGLWSGVRKYVVPRGKPRSTGHLAFRAMVRQADLPPMLRSQVVTAWLGPRFHAVQYPVRGGEWLNIVAIVQGHAPGDPQSWDHSANASELRARLANAQAPLLDLIHAIDDWRLWPLFDRRPMKSASEHARGRIALLGDAAHPMRPYLAQGAGMAIEDAQQLVLSLQTLRGNIPVALQHYADTRWERNARVQARAIRNGRIFHMGWPLRLGRDLSLRALGPRLLDLPWLYGYQA